MKKRILPLLLALVLSIGLLCPVQAQAADPASLTLTYQKEQKTFPGLSVGIYRVAEALPDGTYELLAPYASYPVNIHGITRQEQWYQVAQTLASYIVADGLQPDRQALTDENGVVRFTGLDTGLYYVEETVAEHSDGTYVFNRFLVYLPTPQPDGALDYEVEANPKCTEFVPRTQYTVTKLWQDGGNQSTRPAEVTVQIYHDGVLLETQILNADNHWSYTWNVTGEDTGKWTVKEVNVPEGYQVTLRQNGNVFSLINSAKTQPKPPQTGDTFSPLPWMMIMCTAGVLLLILGLYGRRHKV